MTDIHVSNKHNFSTDVVYQIITDRFHRGNEKGVEKDDTHSADRSSLKLYFGGDWKGIIAKMEYLRDMGITAIWISPPVENITKLVRNKHGAFAAYHGYWARDFKRPNLEFGTFDDFNDLISAAHSAKIKVIIDFAPNHTSPAMEDDEAFGENGRLLDNGEQRSSYTTDVKDRGDDTKAWFHHNGGTTFDTTLEDDIYKNMYDLADLNHNNPDLDRYMKEAIKIWLDCGIDGIRFDAVKHMPFGWQKSFMSYIHSYKPVFSFGEWFLKVNEDDPASVYHANQSGMSLLDFQFAQAVRETFRTGGNGNMRTLDAMIRRTAGEYDEVKDQVTFIDNHDMDRFHIDGKDARRLEQALAFTLTSRGVPALYYGTEQYMTGNNGGSHENRRMMQSWSPDTHAYKVVKRLAPLRKSNPAMAYGTTEQRWISDDVYIYERKFVDNVALVAINRSSAPVHIANLHTSLPPGHYGDVLNGLLDGNSIQVAGGGTVETFQLPQASVAVWQHTAPIEKPAIAHVGPLLGHAGNQVTIDGRGFGPDKGIVFFGENTPAEVVSWEDSQIRVLVPNIAPGVHAVKIRTSAGQSSDAYGKYRMLTGPQVMMRFVLRNAKTRQGESVYLAGDQFELANWSEKEPLGPMFNQVVYRYPDWYMDVSVPAGKTIQFKFLKKSRDSVSWEAGSNHSFPTRRVDVTWKD